jgi:beta-lactam-binding protein with PASTA domain
MSLRRLLSLAIGVVIVFGGGILLADTYLMPWIIHRQSEVLVPTLVGESFENAERAAERLGLSVVVGDEVFSDDLPAGTVLEQRPRPLASVRQGRPIRIVMSKGERLVVVPDLTAMSLRQSELSLTRIGLVLGRISRSYDPGGVLGVVAQRPPAGSPLLSGSEVSVLVREGHDRTHHLMPDLVGRSLTRVSDELTRAGFELRRVTYRSDGDAFPGTILDQWPPAGFRVPTGGGIELVAASRG